MEWLNYHHLLYFWAVAREGSVTKACEKLHLSQPTISGQIKSLEDSLGEKLFARAGRGLALTDVGRVVYRYADEIFGLGREMMDALKGQTAGKPLLLTVGVSDAIPKLIAYRLIKPALDLPEEVRLVCREDRTDRLLAALAVHDLDIVLSDAPMPPSLNVKAYNHLLGECSVAVMGTEALAKQYRRNFPHSLNGAPFLLPLQGTALRYSLDEWLDRMKIRPRIVGEIEDSGLLKAFGQEGVGLFAIPEVISKQVAASYGVRILGEIPAVIERFYAISAERRLQHPAVLAVANTARTKLFGD